MTTNKHDNGTCVHDVGDPCPAAQAEVDRLSDDLAANHALLSTAISTGDVDLLRPIRSATFIGLHRDSAVKPDPGLGKLTAHDLAAIRRILFTVIDSGDPERGGDPWRLDESKDRAEDGRVVAVVSEEDATENRWRFVDAVQGAIMSEAAPQVTGGK